MDAAHKEEIARLEALPSILPHQFKIIVNADALAYFFGFKWGGRGSTFNKLAEKYDGQRETSVIPVRASTFVRWPYPPQLGYRNRLIAQRDGHINALARPQVAQHDPRLINGAVQDLTDRLHTLSMERVIILKPRQINERITNLLLLIRGHNATSIHPSLGNYRRRTQGEYDRHSFVARDRCKQ